MFGLMTSMVLIFDFIKAVAYFVCQLMYYGLVIILPTLIQYIGIPMFLFGCLSGLGVSGAVLFVLFAFFFIYYNYLKRIRNINPFEKAKEKLQEQ
tara:strand:+ start:283 stop:567 length:285 start_codon:yes stop_codon:yes gene_type:complete